MPLISAPLTTWSIDRSFAPLPPVSLDELVPADHFYRHLKRSLDLSIVRDLVHEAHTDIGRPSIDLIPR